MFGFFGRLKIYCEAFNFILHLFKKPKIMIYENVAFTELKCLTFSILADLHTCWITYVVVSSNRQIRPDAPFFHDSLIAALQRKHNCRSTNKKMMQNFLEIYISRPLSNPPFTVSYVLNNETPSFYLSSIVAIFRWNFQSWNLFVA